jgi:hypothetical protein
MSASESAHFDCTHDLMTLASAMISFVESDDAGDSWQAPRLDTARADVADVAQSKRLKSTKIGIAPTPRTSSPSRPTKNLWQDCRPGLAPRWPDHFRPATRASGGCQMVASLANSFRMESLRL